MWDGAAARTRAPVALDVADPELADALADALTRHPALAPADPDDPDEPAAVVVADRAGADAGAVPTLALDALPAEADVELILAAALVTAAGYALVPAAPRHVSPDAPRARLAPRAREVLALLVDGASNKTIARRLGISPHTAKFHVAAVLRELGARNRAEAVAMALREGLVLL